MNAPIAMAGYVIEPQPVPTLRNVKATRFHRLLPLRHLAYQKPPRL